MAYFAPYIDAAGLHISTYNDIRDQFINDAKQIYGQDIYLENDSQDYQFISSFSLIINDTLQALQLAYNNHSPEMAIGAGLASLVKLNGLKPKNTSYSTCQVILSGDAGTLIEGGIVGDINDVNWNLPDSVVVGSDGTVEVSAVCSEIGAITSLPGDISKIVTPTKGWISVVNEVAAIPGQPVETDSQLRIRQSISTELPSQTLLAGTNAGIASVSGVTRNRVYENDTDAVDADGLPPHSITAVVEGGADDDVAQQVYARKGIGGYTNGTTAVSILDIYGLTTTIRFYRPTYVQTFVTLELHKLSGYTDATTSAIKKGIKDYLNGLEIGEDLTISALWGAALSVMPNLSVPIFSLKSVIAGISEESQSTDDIVIAFNEVTKGLIENINVTFV